MKSSFNKKLLLGLGILVIIIAVITLLVLPREKNKTTKTVSNVTTQTNKTSSKATATTNATVKMSELGVTIAVPDSINDLTYAAQTEKTTDGKDLVRAYLSSSSLTSADPACSTTTPGGLGSFSKVSGQYPKGSKTAEAEVGTLAKQFGSFYVAYTSPTSYCSKNQDAISLFRDQFVALTGSFDSIKEIK